MKFTTLGYPTPLLPPTAVRATIECSAQSIWLTGHSPSIANVATSMEQGTLQSRIFCLESDTIWAVQQVLLTDEGVAIAAAIRAGTCISVSDGSF
jgi:hypothetical protein